MNKMQQHHEPENGTERQRKNAEEPENFLWQFGFEQSLMQGYAMLYARGDSMKPRILAGDLVLIQLGAKVQNGEYAAVSIDGGRAELFRVLRQEKGVLLCPDNRAFPMRFFPANAAPRLRIFGRIEKSIRNL